MLSNARDVQPSSYKFLKFFFCAICLQDESCGGRICALDNPVCRAMLCAGQSFVKDNPVCRTILCAGQSCAQDDPVRRTILCVGELCVLKSSVFRRILCTRGSVCNCKTIL